MSTTSKRKIVLTYYGDVGGASPGLEQSIEAAPNTDNSPAQIQLVTLATGDNTITAPAGGSTPKACTIVKPTANTNLLTLKGAGGDTGVKLHLTDPDTISLDPTQTTFILNAAAQTVVRLFWT